LFDEIEKEIKEQTEGRDALNIPVLPET